MRAIHGPGAYLLVRMRVSKLAFLGTNWIFYALLRREFDHATTQRGLRSLVFSPKRSSPSPTVPRASFCWHSLPVTPASGSASSSCERAFSRASRPLAASLASCWCCLSSSGSRHYAGKGWRCWRGHHSGGHPRRPGPLRHQRSALGHATMPLRCVGSGKPSVHPFARRHRPQLARCLRSRRSRAAKRWQWGWHAREPPDAAG